MKFSHHNCNSIKESDYVLFGVCSEAGSRAHTKRKGNIKGPTFFRKVSNKLLKIKRKKEISLFQPEKNIIQKKLFDAGNIKKENVTDFTKEILKVKKIPICIGGDHSISYEVLKAYRKPFTLIYFDAHPDYINNQGSYFGSVVYDIQKLKNCKRVFLLGCREIEEIEHKNLKKDKIKIYYATDFIARGPKNIIKEIKKQIKGDIYLSIDLDVIDPSMAPAVNTPSPGGISSLQILYMVQQLKKMKLKGFDIMELSPPHDIQDRTSQLANRLTIELL